MWAPLHLTSNRDAEPTLAPNRGDFGAGESDSNELSDRNFMGTSVHVGNAISARDHQHLGAGLPLLVAYQTVVGTDHTMNDRSANQNMVRALALLKAVYCCVVGNNTGRVDIDNVDGDTDVTNSHLLVGSQCLPSQTATSGAEHYYRPTRALGVNMDHDSISPTPGRLVDNAVRAIILKRGLLCTPTMGG